MNNNRETVLEVKNLVVSFRTNQGLVHAVRGVSYELYQGETLAIVGESGSGKSVTSRTIMGILAPNAIIEDGSIIYKNQDLINIKEEEFHKIRGNHIGMIFQDPTSSLNPIMKVGKQITEAMILNGKRKKNSYLDYFYKEKNSYFYIKNKIKETKKDKKLSIEDKQRILNEENIKLSNAKIVYENKEKEASQYIDNLYSGYKKEYLETKKDAKQNARKKITAIHQNKEKISDETILSRRKSLILPIALFSAFILAIIALLVSIVVSIAAKPAGIFWLIAVPIVAGIVLYIFSKRTYDKAVRTKQASLRDFEFLKYYFAIIDYFRVIFAVKEDYNRKIKVTKKEARDEALKIMKEVGIMEPEKRYNMYPFQFSGGMKQRIVIAIALMAQPKILICDEPTTALDVTIQAQILELIKVIKQNRNLSVIFITHNLGVVANVADRIAVMYAGKIVEYGSANDVFYNPRHPYTWALMNSMPDLNSKEKLNTIPGTPPNMLFPPKGDAFAVRNKYAMKIDFEEEPPLFKISDTHYAATWLLHPDAPEVERPEEITKRIESVKGYLQSKDGQNAK
ncbi:MAG: ATP-binding cassette domain-containing protein [Acholeplasmatales bacterium]|jgi:oligopeptide transport system ATP-binding protein|nr:ATP-binding cassette domain-containing protein [Acholeplasmatales bacterium]